MNDIIKAAKIRRGAWSAYADQKRTYEGIIACYLDDLKPVDSMVWVDFKWCEKDRRRDPDNIAAGKKFIFDALVKKGILGDDRQKNIIGWSDTFTVDKNNPGVNVIIKSW
jgi:Holliday junction resolvase RusA-like endonuclease